MATAAADTWRIVLLGKTGSGKSSLANTILKESTLFKVCHGSVSGTTVCQPETRKVDGRSVQVIDTPGFFDTDPNSPDISQEVLRCLIECAPGPHAFLLVLKVERFTKHELSVTEVLCQHFTQEALKFTTVVFTQGDQLEEGVTLKDWIRDNKALSFVVEQCGGRCHVFDNKYWKKAQDPYRSNQFQLEELFKTIGQTVEMNGGKYYTNGNLEETQEKIKEEMALIKAEPENANMSEKEVEEKAKENTLRYLQSVLVGVIAGVGVLLGTVLLKR